MQTFEEKLDMKQSLDAKISSIKNERFYLAMPAAEMAAGDARGRLNSFLSQYGGEANIPKSRRGDLARLRENSIKATAVLDKKKAKEAELTAQLSALEEQRAALSLTAGLAEMLRIQKELGEIDAEAATLVAAIKGQDEAGENSAESLFDQEKQRAELLADARLGKDVKAALADVEKELAKASKWIDREIGHQEAINALQGRLTACQEKRARVAKVHQAALPCYLKSCAEEIATDFRIKARALGECVTRLVALHSLIDKMNPADVANAQTCYELSRVVLPGMANDGGPIFRAEDIPLAVEIDKEKAKFAAQGVSFTV